MLKSNLALAVILAVTASAAQADITRLAIDDAWHAGKSISLDYQRAQHALTSAQQALGVTNWDNMEITSSVDGSNLFDSDTDSNWVGSVNVNVPMDAKLSFGSTVTTDDELTLSATYQPYASAWITSQMQLAYDKAVINLAQIETTISSDIESAMLNGSAEQANQILKQASYAIAMLETQQIYARLLAGKSTTTELLQAQQAESEALEANTSAQIAFIEAQQNWQNLTGYSEFDNHIDATMLEQLVDERQQLLRSFNDVTPDSHTLQTLKAELKSAQAELANIEPFSSDLKFSFEYDVSDASATASISANLSPANDNAEEIIDAQLEVSFKQREVNAEYAALLTQKTVSKERIDIQLAALDAALVAQAERQISFDETVYLSNKGKRTELEVKQAELTLQQAHFQVFNSLINVYQAQSDYFGLLDRLTI